MALESPFSPWSSFAEDSDHMRWGAVAIPLLRTDVGLRVVMILRPRSMRFHGGQIAFPGGAMEKTDITPWDTACREAKEEVGLRRESMRFSGVVPTEDVVVSGFRVVPIVVEIADTVKESDLIPNRAEVERIVLLDPDSLSPDPEVKEGFSEGVEYSYPVYPLGGGLSIWGASARMLRNVDRSGFFRRLYL